MNKLILFTLLLTSSMLFSQQKIQKKLNTLRVEKAPKIDGNLNDQAWKNAEEAKDFVMFRPDDGTKEPENIKSIVKVVYDDEAIYFGAYLYDDKPNEIPMEFQTRDNFGNADFFGVVINPQNDGVNQTEFFVMSTGNQNDAQVTSSGEDFSWNAVWQSSVKLVDGGWVVEMKIPYSALRFSNQKVQTWGLNFHRQHRKNRHQYSWNYIDKNKGQIAQYDGLLTGIENIKPPMRLSINPYISGAVANYDGESDYIWSAGMDIKYGLSENFTLDATLIPDFGQAGFDNIRLNLGPFEQRFSEKRAFFTEGTNLFNKGGFFYSRRVGSAPIGRYDFDVENNERILENPNTVDLINAIKISGRTKKGLGIGVFNAITKVTKATVVNDDDNSTREIKTEPLTNYNVLVLDQQFNKTSSVSFVNTNVMRAGRFRDANVSGLLFNLNNKRNTYGLSGGVGMSNLFENETNLTGMQGNVDFDKTAGKHRFGIGMDFRDEDYDQNDLGFQRSNNSVSYDANYSYRILESIGNFNNFNINFQTSIKYLFHLNTTTDSYQVKPNLYTGNHSKLGLHATTKKQLSFGGSVQTTLGNQYDYFEPRNMEQGRYFIDVPFMGYDAYFSSDYNKKFALDLYFFRGFKYDGSRNYTNVSLSPRFRFNKKFNIVYNFNYVIGVNQRGYVNTYNGDIIFGNRDEKGFTNSLSAKYNFTINSALNLSFRHNWSPITYDEQFFKLNIDGTLTESDYAQLENNNSDVNDDITHDVNFNNWNIDLNFKWQFAPGSELVVLYRNQIGTYDNQSRLSFANNLDNLFKEKQLNSLSVKMIYYLDYNMVKSWVN